MIGVGPLIQCHPLQYAQVCWWTTSSSINSTLASISTSTRCTAECRWDTAGSASSSRPHSIWTGRSWRVQLYSSRCWSASRMDIGCRMHVVVVVAGWRRIGIRGSRFESTKLFSVFLGSRDRWRRCWRCLVNGRALNRRRLVNRLERQHAAVRVKCCEMSDFRWIFDLFHGFEMTFWVKFNKAKDIWCAYCNKIRVPSIRATEKYFLILLQ